MFTSESSLSGVVYQAQRRRTRNRYGMVRSTVVLGGDWS